MPQAEDAKQHCSQDHGARVCSFQECVMSWELINYRVGESSMCHCSLRALLRFIPVAVVFLACAAAFHLPPRVSVTPPWLP